MEKKKDITKKSATPKERKTPIRQAIISILSKTKKPDWFAGNDILSDVSYTPKLQFLKYTCENLSCGYDKWLKKPLFSA